MMSKYTEFRVVKWSEAQNGPRVKVEYVRGVRRQVTVESLSGYHFMSISSFLYIAFTNGSRSLACSTFDIPHCDLFGTDHWTMEALVHASMD